MTTTNSETTDTIEMPPTPSNILWPSTQRGRSESFQEIDEVQNEILNIMKNKE